MSGHDARRTMSHLPIEGIARAHIRMGLYGRVRHLRHASRSDARPRSFLEDWEDAPNAPKSVPLVRLGGVCAGVEGPAMGDVLAPQPLGRDRIPHRARTRGGYLRRRSGLK
jgi:hypothetical protein